MKRPLIALLAAAGLMATFAAAGSTATGNRVSPPVRAAQGQDVYRLPNGLVAPQLSGGVTAAAADMLTEDGAGRGIDHEPPFELSTFGCPNVYRAAGIPDNIRANQDCSLRRQAEEWVRVNPTDPSNVIVSQNDSRMGFNQTGLDWSIDGAQHFGDYAIPTQFARCGGTAPTVDAFSDPSHEFASDGTLYYDAIGFDLFDNLNGIWAWASNPEHKGSFLHQPVGSELSATPRTVVEECDPNSAIFHDKQFTAVDSYPNSPFHNNIYITWTMFDFSCGESGFDYCESPIVISRSTDRGLTWSPPQEISGVSEICRFGDAFDPDENKNSCNSDQGSFPLVGPDGTVYVTFTNFNTPGIDQAQQVSQQLFVKSTDGGVTWSEPVRVAFVDQTQPFGERFRCVPGRRCLPPNSYRLSSGPGSMGIDATTGKLAVYWDDFRNGDYPANTNNDIFMSFSTNGGETWTKAVLVSRGDGNDSGDSQPAAQWQAWGDVGENGDLYVAYYDRQHGICDTRGCNDITLATSSNNGESWTYQRITTKSMPNLTCENNPFQCGFLGDYMSIQVTNGEVHIAWADTRGLGHTVEEDVYYASVPA
ncbi:sialidase family protein [soil metagenome]